MSGTDTNRKLLFADCLKLRFFCLLLKGESIETALDTVIKESFKALWRHEKSFNDEE